MLHPGWRINLATAQSVVNLSKIQQERDRPYVIVWALSIVLVMRVTPVLEQSIIALVESPHVMSALLHSVV